MSDNPGRNAKKSLSLHVRLVLPACAAGPGWTNWRQTDQPDSAGWDWWADHSDWRCWCWTVVSLDCPPVSPPCCPQALKPVTVNTSDERKVHHRPTVHSGPCPLWTLLFVVGWLLTVPAACWCISGTDLLRQLYVLPHWDKNCRPNFLPHPVTVYWHWADQSQCWPYIACKGSHWSTLSAGALNHWIQQPPVQQMGTLGSQKGHGKLYQWHETHLGLLWLWVKDLSLFFFSMLCLTLLGSNIVS